VPGVVLSAAARRADALVGATFRGGIMDADWLDRFPRLRLIAKYTIGFDDVDLAAATARGIAVTHCPTEANWGGVAEGTMAMLLTALKRIRERDRAVRTGGWRDPGLEGRYVGARSDGYSGLVIGIVGLGRVGRGVAAPLARAGTRVRSVCFGCPVRASRCAALRSRQLAAPVRRRHAALRSDAGDSRHDR